MSATAVATELLLHPPTYDPAHYDAETRRLLRATIEHFESRGRARLTADFHAQEFHADFLAFAAREGLFSTLLTPAEQAGDNPDKRWDTARIAAMSEVLGFYGINYWYPWQVTVLGLGPVWQSANDDARARAATIMDAGGVAAFGLSEREHGADIYASGMVLTPDGAGGYTATGSKYYIGNGNIAGVVSVFGRVDGVEGPDQYVFFLASAEHPNYHLVQNVVPSQIFVAEFRLEEYPVGAEDVLHVGADAFSAALNTVNIGKFNLGFGGVGLATHALYETITHAHRRILYGAPVTNFPHVRRGLVDAFVRLIGMRLFGDRAVDYFRSATPEDRRYLLFNPITKMQVTTEAQTVITLLSDVAAAKGFEKDGFLPIAKQDVDGLPKLEGTVAVNLALILKFMPAYLFDAQECPPVATRQEPADDAFLFRQGPARGLSKIRFADWRASYDAAADVPNVAVFREQAEALATLIQTAPLSPEQGEDMDLQIVIGELFTLVVYGQLILEQAEIVGLDADVLDELFGVLVRDFSAGAVDLHGKPNATTDQQDQALAAVRRPAADPERFARVWQQVESLSGAYAMGEA